jgi:glyoxylase-like metal-dependent hydrolase (beta-lactamase superfamily II)
MAGRAAVPRAERVLTGIWRLRLPLPWEGVPHGNAWVVANGDGLVLFDTGMGGKGRMRNFELALAQIGFEVSDIDLVVCTHADADHFGLAAPITEAAECELWIHPAWEHVRGAYEDFEGTLDTRLEAARMSGVPLAALERFRERSLDDPDPGFDGLRAPDRPLVDGVEVETDHGIWRTYETPGHAPSHVCLHQPESQLMITGDHLMGRVVLFFHYGFTPDPVGEFLHSHEVIEPLGQNLCLAGHGKPFRDPAVKIAEGRRQIAEMGAQIRGVLAGGDRTAFEIVAEIVGPDNLAGPITAFMLQIVSADLDHLALAGEVAPVADTDPRRWTLT